MEQRKISNAAIIGGLLILGVVIGFVIAGFFRPPLQPAKQFVQHSSESGPGWCCLKAGSTCVEAKRGPLDCLNIKKRGLLFNFDQKGCDASCGRYGQK